MKKEPNAFSVAVNTVIDCGVDLLPGLLTAGEF